MWNLREPFDSTVMEALPKAGFIVRSTRGVVRVERYGCGAEFRRTPTHEGGKAGAEEYQMTLLPAILIGGQFTRLWDAGYQKFLLPDDGR